MRRQHNEQSRKRLHLYFVMLAVGASALTVACRRESSTHYQFEAEPRAVLAQTGIALSNDPKLALSPSGALYMLAVHGDDEGAQLGLMMSHDGGDTFMPLVPVSEKGAEVSSHGENSPNIALTPTEIYALWEQRGAEGGTDLMFARSLSYGHSFEKPTRVTDKTAPSFNGFSSLGVAPNGKVYAVWLDGRDRPEPSDTFSLYLAQSSDRGATFSRNVRVATGVCPCCRPAITFGSNGEVFIAWRKVFDGDIRDMVVSTSHDGGETFTTPSRVAVDNWKLSGCPHSGPAMIQRGGRLYVAWYTEGSEGRAGIKLSWSDDGKSFAPPIFASGNILDANHPALSVSEDGKMLLIFQGRDPAQKEGWSALQPYLVEINDAGEMTPPVPVPSSRKAISYPVVAAGTVGRVFVAWTEPEERGSQIILLRGRKGQS